MHQCYVYTYITHLVAVVHAKAWSQNLYWLLTLGIGGMTAGGNQSSQSNYKCT